MYGWTSGMAGTNCAVFQTRRSTAYYNTSGVKIGTMPTGGYLGVTSGTAGQSNQGLMYVDYWGVEAPSNRQVKCIV